jgi:hypothetical protein
MQLLIVLTRYIESGMAQKPPYEETVVEAETYDGRKIRAIAFTAAAHTCASYEVQGYCCSLLLYCCFTAQSGAIAFKAAAHTCASYEVGGYCCICVS